VSPHETAFETTPMYLPMSNGSDFVGAEILESRDFVGAQMMIPVLPVIFSASFL